MKPQFEVGDRLIDAPAFFDDWDNLSLTNNPISDWLYGEWNERKYNEYLAWNSIYPVRLLFDYILDSRSADEYLDRYGMDYTDIHDPRKMPNARSGSALYGYALNYVSKNVEKLYR